LEQPTQRTEDALNSQPHQPDRSTNGKQKDKHSGLHLIPHLEGDTTAKMKFRAFKYADYSELKRMIHALYREDPGNEQITDEKISKTVKELRKNPSKGKIIIFEKRKVTIGYSILIFYWSDEYGGDILHIDELYVKP